MRSFTSALAVVLFASTAFAQQTEAVGRIKLVSGDVLVVRGQTQLQAQAGQILYQSDMLRTGADGSVGVALKDDTRVALGPASEVRLDHFSYAPAEGQLSLVLKVMRGVVAYVSGRIAKLAPDAVRIETPAAILGVRGTTLAIRDRPNDLRRLGPAIALTLVAAACGHRPRTAPDATGPEVIALLPDPETGVVGRARVSNSAGAVELSEARASTVVLGKRTAPASVVALGEADAGRLFGNVLASLPPRPSISSSTSNSIRMNPRQRAGPCCRRSSPSSRTGRFLKCSSSATRTRSARAAATSGLACGAPSSSESCSSRPG